MSPDLAALDARVFFCVYSAWGGALTGVALFLTAVGSGWAMLALVPMFGVARWRQFATGLTGTLLTSASIVFVVKHIVERRRPFLALPGVVPLTTPPTDASFPSGHANGCFTLAAFVLFVLYAGPKGTVSSRMRATLTVVLVLFAFGIAWSRVYLGVHFPSDVTSGALLGVICGVLGGRLYLQKTA